METRDRAEIVESARQSAIKAIKLLVEAAKTAYKLRMLSTKPEDKHKFFDIEIDCMNKAYDIKDEMVGWILTEEDLAGIEM